MVRPVTLDDAPVLARLYSYYIDNTIITFEEESIPAEEMARRITEITETLPWLVFEEKGEVLGYAYASKWKSRCAYRYTVETTIYLAHEATGNGIGSQLYAALLESLQALSIHAAIGGVALPNAASVALHEKFGFVKVAHFKEVGWKFDHWIDVGYWERILSN